MAGSADAAAAMVRAGHNGVVVPVGGDLAAIDALPVAALRLPSEIATCGSAWNRNPVGGVIGVQTGPH